MRKLLIGVALLAALAWVGWQVVAKEQVVATSRPVFFALGVRDPRSLIQGDYMALNYEIVQMVAKPDGIATPGRGALAVTVDGDGVARSARILTADTPLGHDEVRVAYHTGRGQMVVGPESFFFQEGMDSTFTAARYAELRVAPDGEVLLVSLRDAQMTALGR